MGFVGFIWDLWHFWDLFGIYGIYGIYLGYIGFMGFMGFIWVLSKRCTGFISVIYPSHGVKKESKQTIDPLILTMNQTDTDKQKTSD